MYFSRFLLLSLVFGLTSCIDVAKLSVADGTGPKPVLPSPNHAFLPTIHVAKAVGWQNGAKPKPAAGLTVAAFATALKHPRWLYALPNGDVLVAETNAPSKTADSSSIRSWVMGKVMQYVGASAPSENRLILLRDADHDGVAETQSVFLSGLNSPFGMALIGNDFYVANTDNVMRFHYETGQTAIENRGVKVMDLPAGSINYHWTKNIIATPDGNKLLVTVGSNSNIAEHGMIHEEKRAAILWLDLKTGEQGILASGLRNPNGMAWQPGTDTLWTVVNERDEIGSDLVPDYLTSIKAGGFYGWPYSYYGQHVDQRVQPNNPDLVKQAIAPDFALGPHTASLGLASALGNRLGADYQHGMFIGQHGSWNRRPFSGYKVIFVPFHENQPTGATIEVLSQFINDQGEAQGRPVGVLVDQRGGLLVADDVGNTIWRVTAATQQ